MDQPECVNIERSLNMRALKYQTVGLFCLFAVILITIFSLYFRTAGVSIDVFMIYLIVKAFLAQDESNVTSIFTVS